MKKNRRLSDKEKSQYIGTLILFPFLLLFGLLGKTRELFGTKRRQVVAGVLSFAMIMAILPTAVLATPLNISDYKNLEFESESDGAAEQFNLTPGGTYYFDISDEKNNIGTVNSALPDTSLHYVPFTYAGTVNAYNLTGAMVATEEYAAANQSPRSLFVGDYVVGTAISWQSLNTANLIFGKTFDTNYNLRVLSTGSSALSGGDNIGQPNINEWDQILDKSYSIDHTSNLIKNWAIQFSWGQDRHTTFMLYRAIRGFYGARHWSFDSESNVHTNLGFRPVLEVLNPAELGADGLKTVTLNLNGGKLNNSTGDINIICAGSSFKAPSAEGLTMLAGKEFNGWRDANSAAIYAAGAVVPSTVTSLIAQWWSPSLGSLTEDFDNITSLVASGWTMKNNSAPLGTTNWFQGTPPSNGGPFTSYNGADNAYIGTNFNNTAGGIGTISNWLITPKLVLTNGSALTFYTRKSHLGFGQTDFPDRLEVRMSTSGANPGTGANDTGDFATLLLSVNPALAQNVYPQGWTKYTVTVSGLTEPADGYLAFRYFVTNAGPSGLNSDYIGIDAVSYKAKREQAILGFLGGTPYVKTYTDEPFDIFAMGGSGTGEISYSVASGPATINGNTVTLTGVGTVVLRATKAGDDDYIEKSVERTITVNPKPVTIAGVTAKSKVYDGNNTATLSGGLFLSYKMVADDVSVLPGSATFEDKKVGNGKTVTFTGFALTGADAGKYTLSAQPENVTASITAKPITMNVTIQNKPYDGLNTAVISSASLNSTVSGDTVSLATPYPAAAFVGVNVSEGIAVNFSDSFTLIGADAGNYTLTQPSGITGNIINNYIAVNGTDYTINRTGWGNTDFVVTAKPGFELSQVNSVGGVWSNTLTKSDETAIDDIVFYVRNKATGAISTGTAESYQIDKTAPIGDVKIGESSIKKALNAITFGLFFKDTQSITITSDDLGSGVESLSYKLSSTALDEAEVSVISDWVEYTGSFTVEPDSQRIVYVKITDKAGNVLYIGSDGLVLDGTAPVISGVENGESYCAAVTITVTDANLDTVTVNGIAVTLTDGRLILSPTGAEQTVVATDKAGNSATVNVTVYDGHAWDEGVVTTASTASEKGVKTYICIRCGEIKTEEIAMLAPSVTEGQNGNWKPDEGGTLTFKSDAAFEDFIRVLVDGKEIDSKHYELKEGSIIVTLKADYLATLPVGTHTLGIQSAVGTATTEFTVEAKTEDKTPSNSDDKDPSNSDDTKLPHTGDNSNVILWIVLFFIAAGALTEFVKSRKKAIKESEQEN